MLGMAAELPSMEDLALRAALVMEAIKTIEKPVPARVESHAHLLLHLYTKIIAEPAAEADGHLPSSIASRATAVMFNLLRRIVPSFTAKAFGSQQVLGASVHPQPHATHAPNNQPVPVSLFEEFIKANLHLVYEDLLLCYYSRELLESLEAQESFVPPDRRKMRGFIAIESRSNQDKEDECILV